MISLITNFLYFKTLSTDLEYYSNKESYKFNLSSAPQLISSSSFISYSLVYYTRNNNSLKNTSKFYLLYSFLQNLQEIKMARTDFLILLFIFLLDPKFQACFELLVWWIIIFHPIILLSLWFIILDLKSNYNLRVNLKLLKFIFLMYHSLKYLINLIKNYMILEILLQTQQLFVPYKVVIQLLYPHRHSL